MDLNNYITIIQAAERSGKSVSQIQLLTRTGKIDGAVKIGKIWFLPASAMDNYQPAPQGFASEKGRAFLAKRTAEKEARDAKRPAKRTRGRPKKAGD